MIFKDYYKILSLETNRVSSEQVRTAYRAAAKKYHPDVNVADRLSEEKIKDINEAYRVLSDPSAKRKYDRIWASNVGKKRYEEANRSTGSVFSDFFNMFFGAEGNESIEKNKTEKVKQGKVPIKGENIETSIDASLEECFYGQDKKISLRTVDGHMKVFTITIPAGIRNGEKIRLLAQGKEGIDGGKNGDLFIKVNIQDNKKFKLKGNDIYTSLYLTPWEAALGTKVEVNSIDENLNVYVPEGTGTGEVIKIEGKGYKDGKGGRGDLVIETKIMVPKKMNNEEKEIFEKMKKISNFNPRNY